MATAVRERDLGWKRIRELVEQYSGPKAPVVTVGIQGREADEQRVTDEEGVITQVVLAGVHEFGSEERGIPERSYLRSAFDEHRDKYRSALQRMARLVLQGKLQPAQALGLMGETVASDAKSKIESNIPPPLAPLTIAKKIEKGLGPGPHTALIETGQMRNAITYIVRGVPGAPPVPDTTTEPA